jgi:hypothetical protein
MFAFVLGAWVEVKPSCSERGPVDLGINKSCYVGMEWDGRVS